MSVCWTEQFRGNYLQQGVHKKIKRRHDLPGSKHRSFFQSGIAANHG